MRRESPSVWVCSVLFCPVLLLTRPPVRCRARVASSAIGLDSSHYRRQLVVAANGDGDDDELLALADSAPDFSLCRPFVFPCLNPSCDLIFSMDSPFVGSVSHVALSLYFLIFEAFFVFLQQSNVRFNLSTCANAKCDFVAAAALPVLLNHFRRAVRDVLGKYYEVAEPDCLCDFRFGFDSSEVANV